METTKLKVRNKNTVTKKKNALKGLPVDLRDMRKELVNIKTDH